MQVDLRRGRERALQRRARPERTVGVPGHQNCLRQPAAAEYAADAEERRLLVLRDLRAEQAVGLRADRRRRGERALRRNVRLGWAVGA